MAIKKIGTKIESRIKLIFGNVNSHYSFIHRFNLVDTGFKPGQLFELHELVEMTARLPDGLIRAPGGTACHFRPNI